MPPRCPPGSDGSPSPVTDDTDLGQLRQDPRNVRKHTPRNVGTIEQSLQRAGAGRSLLAAKNANGELVILAGNATWEAAGNVGLEQARFIHTDGTEVVVVVRDDLDADSEDAQFLAVADNRSAELAGWEVPKLLELPPTILDALFVPEELSKLASQLVIPGTEDEADVPIELPSTPAAQVGDVFVWPGMGVLVCGDCRDPAIVATLRAHIQAPFAMIATDPPYAVDYDERIAGRRNQKKPNGGGQKKHGWQPIANDDLSYEELVALITAGLEGAAEARTAIIWHPPLDNRWATWQALEATGWRVKQEIIAAKSSFVFSRNDYHWQHEPATLAVKPGHWSSDDRTQSTLWSVEKQANARHPNQKPLPCYEIGIKHHTTLGEVIYDPFAGAGTCLIACARTKRMAACIELEPVWVDIAVAWMEQVTGVAAERVPG